MSQNLAWLQSILTNSNLETSKRGVRNPRTVAFLDLKQMPFSKLRARSVCADFSGSNLRKLTPVIFGYRVLGGLSHRDLPEAAKTVNAMQCERALRRSAPKSAAWGGGTGEVQTGGAEGNRVAARTYRFSSVSLSVDSTGFWRFWPVFTGFSFCGFYWLQQVVTGFHRFLFLWFLWVRRTRLAGAESVGRRAPRANGESAPVRIARARPGIWARGCDGARPPGTCAACDVVCAR